MVSALLLGFVGGVIARVLLPGRWSATWAGRHPWAVSLGLGLARALV